MDSNFVAINGDFEPGSDMEFESHEAAYEFYKEYAKSVGFGTAKLSSRRSRASKEFIDAKFSCIRYGNKQQSDDAINPRPSPKIGCKASLHVKRKPNGKWYVYKFIKEHNHELLPEQAHFFRSHRNSDSLNNDVRARKRKILASLSKQFSSYQNVGCSDSFMRSQHNKGQSLSLEYGDAQQLLDLFMQMQEDDPRFFYAVDLNEEQRLRNVLWVDTKALTDYTYFGDVVSIDTTYFANKYKSPLLLFVGVNHHIQPTLLGCALIANDTVHTFLWVLQTWLIAMGGRPPQVVLTDESKALKTAVREIMPESRHYFCLWHILEKIPKRLEAISVWLEDFMKKFSKCMCRSWTEEIFEKRWWKLLEKFKLQDNEWLRSIYEARMHWVPVFTQGVSFAALSTSSRCDSVNSYFDKFVNPETSVREFIEQYKVLLGNRFEEEAKAEFEAWHEAPEFKSPSPFEKQMAWVYTHEIFKKFQVEVLGAAACHLKKENEDINIVTYTVKDFEKDQEFTVEWNESNSDISCLCRLFEYQGYLCRHAIVVLQMSGVFSIPFKYVLQRWTNAAWSRHVISEKLDEVQAKVRRYNDLCRRAIILAEEGSLSTESYNAAVSAIRDAFQRCTSANSCFEKDLRSDSFFIHHDEEDIQASHSRISVRDPYIGMNEACVVSGRPEVGNEVVSDRINVNTRVGPVRGSVHKDKATVESQDGFTQMETQNTRPAHLHNMFPVHFHNVVPSVFQGPTPTQYHSTWQEKHLQR
ncbi:protein FAR1-RELATED SEQUENCE 4-like [Silene latifolia]|uniref:protein FAR1-RELATED SEQUENCE 4-like n=1 Tax=Silene latifolia TaxID=37657 RepID=UPI003D77FE65